MTAQRETVLRGEVRKGGFRADLYHRLSVFTVTVPSLRDMGEDRLALLEHFAPAENAPMGVRISDIEAKRGHDERFSEGSVEGKVARLALP